MNSIVQCATCVHVIVVVSKSHLCTGGIALRSYPGEELIQALYNARSGHNLLLTVYLITQYLWFVPWDPGTLETPDFEMLVSNLSELHNSTALRPGSKAFSTTQLCLRSLLEILWGRIGVSPGEAYAQGGKSPAHNRWELQTEDEASTTDKQVDPRLVQLCCPTLDQARSALKVHVCFAHALAVSKNP